MPDPTPPGSDVPADDIRRSTRRAFAAWAAAGAAGAAAFAWLKTRSKEAETGWPLRRVQRANESVARGLGAPNGRAPEFPKAAAGDPKENGWHGEPDGPRVWRVSVERPDAPTQSLTLAELFAGVPRTESVTELKCVEGWSQVVHWAGYRFADIAAARGWPTNVPYVSLATAGGGYYVGLDTASAMHPQTLLADKMNDRDLTPGHGHPVRLVIPTKYGIKNIKWVAAIAFTTARPADYWQERGYDWYAGL